jgi:FdhD protein
MAKEKKTKIQKIIKISKGEVQSVEDEVVEESSLSIYLNNKKLVTLMNTPSDQKYLALGFLFSEGWVKEKGDLKKILFDSRKNEVKVFTKKTIKVPEDFSESSILTSGCGKGKSFQKLNDVDPLADIMINLEFTITLDQIEKLIKEFEQKSYVFRSTGGTHSAALADKERILLFKEDIGRHNAVDKVLGEALFRGISIDDKFLILSGRISSDILLKSARGKINLIISRSAPTSLAIELAQKLGITIVGFARGKRLNIYTYPARVSLN